jgi:hypothetical protein
MTVIERTEGCYQVQEVEFGKVYRWEPGNVVVECDCGERLTLTRSESNCEECGTDHADAVLKMLADRRLEDETRHPWRYAGDHEGAGLPC